jgi:hypothetical protein
MPPQPEPQPGVRPPDLRVRASQIIARAMALPLDFQPSMNARTTVRTMGDMLPSELRFTTEPDE